MKSLYIILAVSTLIFTGCTKRDYIPTQIDEQQWMRTHEEGTVAYVDYYSGNYIVETYDGYAVIEASGNYTPREYDSEYAHFSNRGLQNIYNRNGNYFTTARVVDSWLSWSEARYILDDLNYQAY
jgi:hypothetical protein